ncbi:hypothetical protein [Helicobacter sp. T3_23-1056]
MKKLILFLLISDIVCSNDLGSAFATIASKETLDKQVEWLYEQCCRPAIVETNECVKPSFSCEKVQENTSEWLLCYNHNAFLDNIFTSYYNLIMRHTPKVQKSKVKAIAKEAMKLRDKNVKKDIESVNNYLAKLDREAENGDEEADASRRVYWRNLEDPYFAIRMRIDSAYLIGISNLTNYLLEQNPQLFEAIFHKHTQSYRVILGESNGNFNYDRVWAALYLDGLIDKNGAIVGDSHNDLHESSDNLKRK